MGCQEIPRKGGGSHRKWYNPHNNVVVPIPDWGNKDLKLGTYFKTNYPSTWS